MSISKFGLFVTIFYQFQELRPVSQIVFTQTHSLDIGGQIFYHIHTSCDKHCGATLQHKYKLRVKSKDSERSHGDPTNTMYVTLYTVNLNTADTFKHC